MNNNRELLELAAKAAGLYDEWPAPDCGVDWNGQGLWCFGNGEGVLWNPITDDGDRYELAKTLNMMIDFNAKVAAAQLPDDGLLFVGWGEDNDYETDAEAVVGLAAEIGRRKP